MVNLQLEQKLAAETKLTDKLWRLSHYYKIKTKRKLLEVMTPNEAQVDYFLRRTIRNYILKARQLGFSTFCLLDLLDETLFTPNTNSAIVAHKAEKVTKLFEIVKRGFESMPAEIKPRVSFDNRNELYFPDLDSKIYVTMDSRSETVHNLHVSELAFIKGADEKMLGILESVPDGGRITYETTANGMTGYAYEEWNSDESEFEKFFYAWMWDPNYAVPTEKSMEELMEEYIVLAVRYGTIQDIVQRFDLSKEQLNFYIGKIKRHKAKVVQEYPTTDLEAFISAGRTIFHIQDIQKHEPTNPIERKWHDCMIWEKPLHGFKYTVGVDSSEGTGNDNAAICVLNAHTGEQAAEFASNDVKPDVLAGHVIEIAKWYNNAFVVPEINSSGISLVDHLKRRYMNIYRREVFDKRTKENTEAIGWRTTGVTKPLLVNDLEEAMREEYILLHSDDLLKEMRTFVRTDEQGKDGFGAEGSNKDDRVIACGLAYQGIKHMPSMKLPESEAQKKMREYIEQKQYERDFPSGSNQPISMRNRKKYFIRKD